MCKSGIGPFRHHAEGERSMKVDGVTAIIKHSQGAIGPRKAVEIGAEGTVDGRENWLTAQTFTSSYSGT